MLYIMSKKRLRQIEHQIETIKSQLHAIAIVRPGSLTRQYRDPQKRSGAFHQLSYTHQMKSHTEYVRAPFVSEIRQQIRDYKRFKKLMARWVELGIEYSRLSMKDRIESADSQADEPR